MAELGAVLGGRYRLEQVLGQGGMATIFRGTDDQLGRVVAVKVLRPEFGADAAFVERFRREARAAASLSHPNIVAVYDFGADRAGPYIVMEQVAGGDLSAVLRERGPLPATAVARTGQQIADALAAAHARGLVHRDIKPGNVLLSPDGRVQVADFGIAQATASAQVTATGITLGSVLYMSPEQARGEAATAASDVYSLGLVMYEMLTGQRAFAGDSPAAVAVARMSGGVPSPSALRSNVPPALDALVRWCLAPSPSARPSAADLSTALARFLADPAAANAAAAPMPPRPGSVPLTAPAHAASAHGAAALALERDRSGSGPWTAMAAGLGLLVLTVSGVLLFLLFSGVADDPTASAPEPVPTIATVMTPDLVGSLEGPAARAVADHGLTLRMDYREASADQAGRILEQLPRPGVAIEPGTAVQVTIGTLSEIVVVPDVHGMNEETAVNQLAKAGLKAGSRTTADDQLPDGYVVATEPDAGVSMTRGAVVDYVISSGTSADPAVFTADAGPEAIADDGAELGFIAGPGVVIPDATVPTPVPPPLPAAEPALVGSFLCLDLATARLQLAEVELMLGSTIGHEVGDDWLIHDQLPRAGRTVPVGTAVHLMLRDPLEACPAG